MGIVKWDQTVIILQDILPLHLDNSDQLHITHQRLIRLALIPLIAHNNMVP
jgi:hypothetical protein